MLTAHLVRPTYRLISIYSRLNFIPFKVDAFTGRATASRTTLRRCSWFLNYTCLVLLVGFLNLKLLQSLLSTEFNPVHFPIHFIISSFLALSIYCMYVLFIASPLSTIQVYNEVVDHLQLELVKTAGGGIQDLLLLTYPFLLMSSGVGVLTICAIDPQRMQLFYAILSPDYQTPIALALNIVTEYVIYNVGYAVMSYGVFMHLAFFRNCLHQLKNFEEGRRGKVKRLRRFHLTLVIFNRSQANLVFVFKIFLILSAVCMNFYGIQVMKYNSLVGIFSLAVAMYAEVSFIALYDNAFAIPLRFRQVRAEVLKSAMNDGLSRRALLRRQMRALPVMGIKVGQFSYLERESTPNFLDFVVTNTANLLLTFR